MGVQPTRGVGTNRRPLLKKDIETAQLHTKSAAEAARYLHVNYSTYKKYARLYGIFEQHKNQFGKGISRQKKKGVFGLDDILAGKYPTYDRGKLKERLIRAGYLPQRCDLCGYEKQRFLDGRSPLVLQNRDGNPNNLLLENLQLICYNCYYCTTGKVANRDLLNPGVYDRDLLDTQQLTTDDITSLQDEMWQDSE